MNSHYFFAAVLPGHIKKVIFEEMKNRHYPFKRFTHPEDYHITLAFVGAAEMLSLQEACGLIEKSIQPISSFQLRLDSFGTFGSKTEPRVFWVGTNEPETLFQIQKEVAASCRKAGLSIDEKPFRPHITTARKWNDPDHPYKKKKEPDWPSFYLKEIALYETNPFTEPRYTKKWSCQLRDAGEGDADGSIN